jgi:hypothetical protein
MSASSEAYVNNIPGEFTMIYLLFFLIPIVLLLAWGVMVDRKRRRSEHLGHDVNVAARTARLDVERRTTEWGTGL